MLLGKFISSNSLRPIQLEGAFLQYAPIHPIHSPGKFTPHHPWWTSLKPELAKKIVRCRDLGLKVAWV